MFFRFLNLKSNMDRFIGATLIASAFSLAHLKSNMDRFIGGIYYARKEHF